MEFIIHQEPIAKKRHRHGKHGGYDEQHKEKNSLKWQFGSQMRENGHKRLSRDPLDVAVRCYCSPPKTLSQAKKRALEGQFKTKKPDADNYFKFYTDVLNGIAYEDDNLISSMSCFKKYSENPRVEITIKSLNETKEKSW